MMTHDADHEFELSRWIDGDLSADEASRLEAAIARNPEWQRDYTALVGVDQRVREAAGPLPDVDWNGFRNRVARGVEAESRSRSRRRRLFRLSVPIATAAAMALYVSLTSTTTGPTPPIEPEFQVAYAPAESIVPTGPGSEILIPIGRPGAALRFEPPAPSATRRAAEDHRRVLMVVTFGDGSGSGS